MVCSFISNPQSAFYDSPAFQRILAYVQSSPKDCKMSEKNDKLRMIYSNILAVEHAFKRLEEVSMVIKPVLE
jgi:transcription-repair coupling factor (superfamily II helicase)